MTASHDLRVADLTLGYSERDIIKNLDLHIAPGKISVIVGANACGNSTLLKPTSRLIAPRRARLSWMAKKSTGSRRKSSVPGWGFCRRCRLLRKTSL